LKRAAQRIAAALSDEEMRRHFEQAGAVQVFGID
jgi:hypothetical protein